MSSKTGNQVINHTSVLSWPAELDQPEVEPAAGKHLAFLKQNAA